MSGEVFSQSSKSKNKKKVRTVQVEENQPVENTTEPVNLGKARIDTKDGSMYLGDYLGETEDGHSIRIITGDTLSITTKEIRRAVTPNSAIVFNKGRYHPIKGLFMHYSIGTNGGQSGGGFITDAGLGYRLSQKIEIMSGLGFIGTTLDVVPGGDFWWSYNRFFPAYLGMNYNLTHGKVRIFTSAKAGYSISAGNNLNTLIWGGNEVSTSGGAYFEPAIGLSFASKRFGRVHLSLTQILQNTKVEVNATDSFDNLIYGQGKIWISRIGLRLTTTLF